MKLKIFIMAVICLAGLNEAGEIPEWNPVADPATETATIKDGYALLNSILSLFENLPSENGIATVESRIAQLSRDAKAAREADQIDLIFFNRYRRVLIIFKLITMPIVKNEILEPIFMAQFSDFVHDVTYENWNWGDKDSIAKLAAAMEEEFVQLQLYLDNRQKRDEMKKKIGKRMLPPPPPPPGSKPNKKTP